MDDPEQHGAAATEEIAEFPSSFSLDRSTVDKVLAAQQARRQQKMRDWTDADARRILGKFLLMKVDCDNLTPLDSATAWLNHDVVTGYLQSILLSCSSLKLSRIVCLHPSQVEVLGDGSGPIRLSMGFEFNEDVPPLWNIFETLDVLLLPVNSNRNHWLIVFIDFTREAVVLYDSLAAISTAQSLWLCQIRDFLKYEHLKVTHVELPSSWTFQVHPTAQKQKDGWNCGVFVCGIGRQFVESWSSDYQKLPSGSNICKDDPPSLQEFRQQIKRQILAQVAYQKELRAQS